MREEENKKKKLLIIIAIIATIVIAVVGVVLIKTVRQRNVGQMYTYIDYYEGTTEEINYYIDEENHAYYYRKRQKIYVLLSPNILEKNKAGELTVDSRDIYTLADNTEPSESVSN